MNQNGTSSPQMDRINRSRSRSPIDQSPDGRHSRDSSQNRDRQQRNQRSRSSGGERRSRAPSDRRVYIANIPYDCKWTDIKDLFRDKVGDVSYVELFEDENGKFRGCGIVELKDKASVSKAIEVLHRHEMKGRFLVVKEDFDVERDRSGRPVNKNKSGNMRESRDGRSMSNSFGMGGNVPSFNTYGLSPQFLESLGITGPLSNRVFVANLDYKVNTKKLQEIFKLAGKVLNIELKTDKDGNSKGHGIIEFDHPVEAVQAISMFNGQKLFNRTMSVRMDKYNEEMDGGLPSKLPSGLSGVGKGLGAGGTPLHMTAAAMAASSTPNMNMGMSNMGMGMGSGTSGIGGMMGGTGGMGGIGSGMGGMGSTGMGNMGMSSMGTGMGNMGSGLSSERSMLGNSIGGMGSSGGMGVGSSGGSMGMGMGASSMMGGNLGSGMGSSLGGGMGSGMMGLGGTGTGSGVGGGSIGGSLHSDYGRTGDGYRSPRSSDTIIVQNLPPNYTWQNLRDRFRDIGNVRYTEVKGRGTAVVRFTSERDAQRAVELMHGIRIDNRPIEVRLY